MQVRSCEVEGRWKYPTHRSGVCPLSVSQAGDLSKGPRWTDTKTILSIAFLALRRRKIVSSHIFKVESRERGLTSPHQRCDGKRPCMACVKGGRDAGCTYEPGQPSRRTSNKLLSVSRNGSYCPPSTRTSPLQASTNGCSFLEFLTCPPSKTPLLNLSNSGESASDVPMPRSHGERALVRKTRYSSELTPPPTVSSFTVLPSIHFRTIPRPSRVPLSLVPPEHVRISSTARSDLDMIL